jgi:hypothetical protein
MPFVCRFVALALFALLVVVPTGSLRAQVEITTAEGRSISLNGPVRRAFGTQAWVVSPEGKRVIAKVEATIGSNAIVMMPDGRLMGCPLDRMQSTDLPFLSYTMQEVGDALVKSDFPSFQVKTSVHHVFVHDCSPEFLETAKKLLETVHPVVYQFFQQRGFKVKVPDVPLAVVIFRKQEDLVRWANLPPNVLAYYDPVRNHIYLWEEASNGNVAANSTRELILNTVGHEAVHQTLHNIGIQNRLSRWPAWLSEGLPEFFEPMFKGDRWAGLGATNDFRYHELRSHFTRTDRATGNVVRSTVAAPGLTSSGYASAWALTHYLALRHEERFFEYVRQVSERGPEEGIMFAMQEDKIKEAVQRDADEFATNFGNNYRDIESAMFSHLSRLRSRNPVANDKHYVLTVEFLTGGRKQRVAYVTLDPDVAREAHGKLRDKLSPTELARARFRLLEFQNKPEAERHARIWAGTYGSVVSQ